jgi:hypothetical protein
VVFKVAGRANVASESTRYASPSWLYDFYHLTPEKLHFSDSNKHVELNNFLATYTCSSDARWVVTFDLSQVSSFLDPGKLAGIGRISKSCLQETYVLWWLVVYTDG